MQRLGLYSQAQPDHCSAHTLWIHAASVGEVFTVLPLLKTVNAPLLVTTMSPTGAAVLEHQALPNITHQYLPLDLPGACKRFFKQAAIKEGWIVETEIWPWLYACAKQHRIPLTIINARLSDRTSKRVNGILTTTFQQAVTDIKILARSEDDAQRFVALGADKASIKTVGNLKYAAANIDRDEQTLVSLVERPYVLIASTHDDEEEQLALAWQQVLRSRHAQDVENNTAPVMVIVPRHPERGLAIHKQLANHGVHAPMRSMQATFDADTQYFIADTLGELQAWYAFAKACFVGGSLIERGGHNVLEAARARCPIVVGPHTFNFTDIVDTLAKEQALLVAETADEVAMLLAKVAADPQQFAPMVERANEQAKRSEGVLKDYLELLV